MPDKPAQPKKFEFTCVDCGEVHHGSPSFSYEYPTFYYDVPEQDRANRIIASDDLCRISPALDDPDGTVFYFLRVTLSIPIIGAHDPFTWGVWVSQSKASFDQYLDSVSQDQSGLASFGWLAVTLPYYSSSAPEAPLVNLECNVPWGNKGQRPDIILWDSNHPLAVDQRNGITWDKAVKIATLMAHP